jgi:hypothetical protein
VEGEDDGEDEEGGDVARNIGWRAWGGEGVVSGGGRRRREQGRRRRRGGGRCLREDRARGRKNNRGVFTKTSSRHLFADGGSTF